MRLEKFLNLPINSVFNLGKAKIKIIESLKNSHNTCEGCIFDDDTCVHCVKLEEIGALPLCDGCEREDGKNIIFKEVKE